MAIEQPRNQSVGLDDVDVEHTPISPADLANIIRSEQLKTVLEASRFPEMSWACNVIGGRSRVPLSQKINMMSFKSFVSSQGVATSFFSSEDDRKIIMGEVTLLKALFYLTGFRDDINSQRTFELDLGVFASEVQTRKGIKAQHARLLTMAIQRVEQSPSERSKPQGFLERLGLGGSH